MSTIVDLLMVKAASFREEATAVEPSAKPAQEVDSWAQVKQAAVSALVEQAGLEEAVAASLVDELGAQYGNK